MNRIIKAIVLDWAGTTVDFGSIAPVAAFRRAFEAYGLFPGNDLIERIESIKWWDWDHGTIKERLSDFRNKEEFIRKYL